ncbi:MAG: NUDIX hydrolase [Treponema sp.]|nr:NUDIX hydrolase [Treponema sp.]
MDEDGFSWKEEGRKKVFDCAIFSIRESYCRSARAGLRAYTVIDASDWVIVVPVLETAQGKKFVMARQWRHGSGCQTLEFPGGVCESGEDPAQAAAREMLEETGYRPGSLRRLGALSPNPAIMSNRAHVFLAENLIDTGRTEFDPDEYVETELVAIEDAMRGMGRPPYVHALMGSALLYYLQDSRVVPPASQ